MQMKGLDNKKVLKCLIIFTLGHNFISFLIIYRAKNSNPVFWGHPVQVEGHFKLRSQSFLMAK